MSLVDKLELVKSKSFREIESSELALTLLYVYSELYLYGTQPPFCGKCMADFYNILFKSESMELAKQYDLAKQRTCEPAWVGIRYVRQMAKDYTDRLMYDELAIDLLTRGFLTEKDFKKLPDGWVVEKQKEEPKKAIKRTYKKK